MNVAPKSLGIRIIVILIVFIFLIIIVVPILWLFSVSFRGIGGLSDSYFFIIPKEIVNNYPEAIDWTKDNYKTPPLTRLIFNSSVVTFTSVFLTVVISSITAFAFSRFKFKFREVIFLLILAVMMIPVQVTLIPIFIVNKWLGLLNNYLAVILPYTAFGIPLSTFILRGFFDQIPNEVEEAATIDGASKFKIFFYLYIPIARPAFATCIILTALLNWNELIFAVVFLRKMNMLTIPVALASIAGGEELLSMGVYVAFLFLTCLPVMIVFFIFQKWIVAGFVEGIAKG